MLGIQTYGAAILTSPVFLFQFKAVLFLLWLLSCCKISWDSVQIMSTDLQDLFFYEAFLYYNPLLLVNLMVWLWGINLWIFSQSPVSYARVFDFDKSHLTHNEIWKCAKWMTIIVPTSMTSYLYLYSHGKISLAAFQPVILYVIAVTLLVFPFDIFYLSSRYFLLRTIWRIILPFQAITFADFFLADIMTSMSKVFSDLERSACRMLNKQVATIAWFEADSVCGSHSIAIPLVLIFPYLFRFFQCIRQFKDTNDKSCLFNALKYMSVIPVICFSALKYHIINDSWTKLYRPLWIISSLINSLYSFYWDLTRDWDLSILSRIFNFKNPSFWSDILHGKSWVYYWVIISNLILRCTWTYKLSSHLRHNYMTVFIITALEIVRRFQWIFFRVENEWNKITNKQWMLVELSNSSEEETLI
ncbi:hypothetical protein LUZ60_002462 [Juncus effusus]|nr:hypothetical protein LUZ60_002462 [Juncus effusus]